VYSPGQVREFLKSLRVPLYVWSTGEGEDLGWGPTVRLTNQKIVRRASKAVLREVREQSVAWIEGKHMVNEIELTGDDDSIWLAGNPPG
jgi:hypothetical protein